MHALSERIRYSSHAIGEHDIHTCTLWDLNQFHDPDHEARDLGISSALWPIFGVIWPSGHVLAELMAKRELEGVSVLEVGCGVGIASLVANRRGAATAATDRHPRAGFFLERNTALNGDPEIRFQRLGWGDPEADSHLGTFELILGSDLLYERDQVDDLAAFITRHAAPTCTVVLVDPGRGRVGRMSRAMAAHGFAYERLEIPAVLLEAHGAKIKAHQYTRS